ncbi:D-alanyl-D-alanine-carboxypeptidase/endopeptidase AmpH precursor [Aquisphaera giovannonii]|uniref:D-alanyl-D-alanine-carboxypeptidase/endopeptidase AmpH n=1 Tax=Aquisphaera giovannonii TaxID=406548 RepID=A0A5B9WAU2_9BACT|nr:serine hydrolase [Aquisphaera giovannonii]QEH37587.1 D-alanyl-D-alanine-carboxypeptidase/endopeptidase AmpH precursor [Aquisphaera giovannonii]
MKRLDRWRSPVAIACAWAALSAFARGDEPARRKAWEWGPPSMDDAGIDRSAMEKVWTSLEGRRTTALLVIRHDRVAYERYAGGHGRHRPHYTASMAKAIVGGLGLILAMGDGLIRPDDPAARYVPGWGRDASRRAITVRQLATHTSGIEDAEGGGVPHEWLRGWKGDFWRYLPPPRDPFTLARDEASIIDVPGTRARYSNPGVAMLAYCLAASLRGAPDPDLRNLLKHRVMEPLGVPYDEWSIGYGKTTQVDGLPLVATWGGGSYSPDAVARVGRLMLRRGVWEGHQRLRPEAVARALEPGCVPGHSGLGWWVNQGADGTRLWRSAPDDAFGGAGAGHQLLLVVPSLDVIVVRNGEPLDPALDFDEALDRHLIGPVLGTLAAPVGTARPGAR